MGQQPFNVKSPSPRQQFLQALLPPLTTRRLVQVQYALVCGANTEIALPLKYEKQKKSSTYCRKGPRRRHLGQISRPPRSPCPARRSPHSQALCFPLRYALTFQSFTISLPQYLEISRISDHRLLESLVSDSPFPKEPVRAIFPWHNTRNCQQQRRGEFLLIGALPKWIRKILFLESTAHAMRITTNADLRRRG